MPAFHPWPLPAGPNRSRVAIATVQKATAAEVYQAHTSALDMYVRLLACSVNTSISAAAELAQLAETAVTVGLLPPVPQQGATPKWSPTQSTISPPEFDRFCAAVLSWAPNLGSLYHLVCSHVAMLTLPNMVGTSDVLLPWLPGGGWEWNDTRVMHQTWVQRAPQPTVSHVVMYTALAACLLGTFRPLLCIPHSRVCLANS
jgi:hypothetical protein